MWPRRGSIQKKARAYFAEARKVFQAAHDRYKEAYDKFDKFIAKEEKEKYDAREEAYRHYIQAQLNLAVLIYEEAQTYDKGSPENKKLLTRRRQGISARFTPSIASRSPACTPAYGRGSASKKRMKSSRRWAFTTSFWGTNPGKGGTTLKNLQDRVRHFRLICLNREQRKDYQVVIQEAQEWLKENRGPAGNTRTGLGIQWEMVRALEMLAQEGRNGRGRQETGCSTRR